MGRVLRTTQALEDLDAIWNYIARDNVTAADRLIDRLYGRFKLLAEFPESGELQPYLSDGHYRRIVQGNYVVYYLPDDADVTIVRVLHAAREEFDLP
jgi:toxin ParE1/3/4